MHSPMTCPIPCSLTIRMRLISQLINSSSLTSHSQSLLQNKHLPGEGRMKMGGLKQRLYKILGSQQGVLWEM